MRNKMMAHRMLPLWLFLTFCLFWSTAGAQDSSESKTPDSASQEESEKDGTDNQKSDKPDNSSEPQVSAMPDKRDKKADTPTPENQELDTLDELEVREDVGPDPTRLLETPLILKTEEERKKELIDRHMDVASQILNNWTLPILGNSLASFAEEKQRRQKLETFKERQKRQLQVLKNVDEKYYKERREEYYETLSRARASWENEAESSY